MATPEQAPDFTPGYPSNGTRLGAAWQRIWAVLRTGPAIGVELAADDAIRAAGTEHEIAASTVLTLLQQGRRYGHLASEMRTGRRHPGAVERTYAVYSIKGGDQ